MARNTEAKALGSDERFDDEDIGGVVATLLRENCGNQECAMRYDAATFEDLKCIGVARDAGEPKSITLCFDRPISDDEMRVLQIHVKAWIGGKQRPAGGERLW